MTWSGPASKPPGKSARPGGVADHGQGGGVGGTPEAMAGPSLATNSGPFAAFSGSPTIGGLAARRFPLVTSSLSSSVAASTGSPVYASDNGVAVGPVAAARPGNSWQGIAFLVALALTASLIAYIASSWSRDRWRPHRGRPTER